MMLIQPAPNRAPGWNEFNVHLWWHANEDAATVPRARRGRLDVLLRRVLSRYLDVPAEGLRFAREARGRPYLLGTDRVEDDVPDFNLSDTLGGTVIAVAERGRVGVDLERFDRVLPHRKLAQRYFSECECTVLEAMDDDAARRAFLRLWTAKEASCKSTGTGIYGQLSHWVFDARAESPTLIALPAAAGEAARWHYLRLTPVSGYTAVLACDGWRPRAMGFVLAD